MNKFYEAANIISVFFFMPVLIFLAYNARTSSVGGDKNNGVVIQSPELPITPVNPSHKPNLEVAPDESIVPSPDVAPIPEPKPTPIPGRRPLLRPRQPRVDGGYCPSGSFSPGSCF